MTLALLETASKSPSETTTSETFAETTASESSSASETSSKASSVTFSKATSEASAKATTASVTSAEAASETPASALLAWLSAGRTKDSHNGHQQDHDEDGLWMGIKGGRRLNGNTEEEGIGKERKRKSKR